MYIRKDRIKMKFNELLSDKSECRLAFLGGSITEGAGASVPGKRYSSLFTEMMNKRIPEVKFTEINAGVGGTPSALGLFRLKSEVLDKNPDVLFVEFAVNDSGYGDQMFKYMEGIVRTARRWKNDLPIVFLFTYPANDYTVKGQIKLAEAYKIPYVNMSEDLKVKINYYGGNDRFLTQDGCHPNDKGYDSYVDSMMRDVFNAEFEFAFPEKPIFGTDFINPVLIPAETLTLPEGWLLSNRTLWMNPLRYICADKPGTSITFEFEGTACGLYGRIEKDGGKADITIDGKPCGVSCFWDKYALGFDRNSFSLLADGLEYGKHTVTLTVKAEKDEQSEGHVIRIAAFLAG